MDDKAITRRDSLKAAASVVIAPYLGALTEPVTPASRVGEGPVDPEWFGASAALDDNHAAIVAADAFARANGREVRFRPGIYNILSDILMTSTWRLDDRTILRFAGPQVPGGRRLVQMRSYRGAAHRTVRLGQPAVYTRAALKDAAAGARAVVAETAVDARGFPPGAIVRVSFGYDPYDADGQLYRFDRLNRVIKSDPSTGKIELETPIPVPLKGWGFEPSGPFYNPPNWENGIAIALLECRYHPFLAPGQAGNPNLGGVFRATSSGRTMGRDLLNDTGVNWERVTNDYNGPDNNFYPPPHGRGTAFIDGRPVIELVEYPIADTGLYGGTIVWAGAFAAAMGVDMRSVYNCHCEGVTIRSETHHIGNRWSVTEAASLCVLDSNTDRGKAASAPPDQDRTVMIYGADLVVRRHDCSQAWSFPKTPLIFAENFGILNISDGCVFANHSHSENTYGCIAGGGAEISMSGSQISGFTIPFRQQASFTSAVDKQWFDSGRYESLYNNSIEISERQIRFAPHDDSTRSLYVGNKLTLSDADTDHKNGRLFEPKAIVPIEFEFYPSPNRTNATVDYDSAANRNVPSQGKGSLIFLYVEAWWDNPQAGGRVVIYPRRSNGGPGTLLASKAMPSAGIVLTAATPRGTMSGDGTSGRLVDHLAGEELRISYDSNALAGNGKVRARIWVLV